MWFCPAKFSCIGAGGWRVLSKFHQGFNVVKPDEQRVYATVIIVMDHGILAGKRSEEMRGNGDSLMMIGEMDSRSIWSLGSRRNELQEWTW